MALDRRWVLLGLGALGGCAGVGDAPLPDYLFSLTVWASGPKIDFLLLNTTEHPLRVINLLPQGLGVRVRDDAGAALTADYAPLFEPLRPEALDPRKARRVRAWKAAKGSIAAAELARRLQPVLAQPLDPARKYDLDFLVEAPVVDPSGVVRIARVKTRSLCAASFAAGGWRADCRSAI
jgi:hypothetical protein